MQSYQLCSSGTDLSPATSLSLSIYNLLLDGSYLGYLQIAPDGCGVQGCPKQAMQNFHTRGRFFGAHIFSCNLSYCRYYLEMRKEDRIWEESCNHAENCYLWSCTYWHTYIIKILQILQNQRENRDNISNYRPKNPYWEKVTINNEKFKLSFNFLTILCPKNRPRDNST